MSCITPNDLVFSKNSDGDLQSGGYKVNSVFLKNQIPIMTTLNSPISQQKGGGVAHAVGDIFNDLAVPAGLLYIQQTYTPSNKYDTIHQDKVASEGLYDKLLNLVTPEKRKLYSIQTRRNRIKSKKNKTRKFSKN